MFITESTSLKLIILKNVDQDTPGQTVPIYVLILLMVTSVKEYVTVTTKRVIFQQDAEFLQPST